MSNPVSICAIAKNEGLYLREWVEFHRLVGVSHFTIYDNSSTDDTARILSEFPCVEVIPWPMPKPCQLAAYQHYLDRHHGESIWAAFIDCDEFLFPVQHDTISAALEVIVAGHPHVGAIGVNWACFGSSGRQSYSSEPVIERFTQTLPPGNPVNQHIKSVIRMDQEVKVGGDPHYFNVERGTFNELGKPIHGPFSPHTSGLLRVNHYITKSYEEWLTRAALGTPDITAVVVDPEEFLRYQGGAMKDRCIQWFLPELKRRLGCRD